MSKRSYLARIEKLKTNIVGKLVIFRLVDGRKYGFKRGSVLTAFSNAIYGEGDPVETEVLMNAVEASDNSRLHTLLKMVIGEDGV